jgi:polyphenol oxidase
MHEQVSFLTPTIFQGFTELIAAETTRHGGVSPVPYQSLNLGKNTEDAQENIDQNRGIISKKLGMAWSDVALSKQVHGSEILVATTPGAYEGFDAIITDRVGVYCSITVADCTPILIYDPVHKAVGAAHAGWRGAAQKIGSKTLLSMQKAFGTQPKDCRVYIGTCISESQMEVGMEVVAEFDGDFCRRREKEGKYLLDLKGAIKADMLGVGMLDAQIELSKHCTWEQNDHYFSHRREKGQTGRFMAIIGMKPQELVK